MGCLLMFTAFITKVIDFFFCCCFFFIVINVLLFKLWIRQFFHCEEKQKTHECWHESPWIVWELPRSMKIWSALKCPGLVRFNRSNNPLKSLPSTWRWPELRYLHFTGQSGHSFTSTVTGDLPILRPKADGKHNHCVLLWMNLRILPRLRPFSKGLSFNNIVAWRWRVNGLNVHNFDHLTAWFSSFMYCSTFWTLKIKMLIFKEVFQ